MLLTGISLLGWLHSLACMIAIVAGTHVLWAPKGTPSHRKWGWWYAAAMIVQSLLVMGLYNFDFIPGQRAKPGPHVFGFFHVGALIAMAAIALALFGARRQHKSLLWALVHAQAMLFSYYLLISALINELFARIVPLRHYALALSPHAATIINTGLVRYAQLAWMVVWALAAIWVAQKIASRRRPPERTVGYPMRYSGGAFVACVGLGIVLGAIAGMLFWGFLIGVGAGIAMARRASRLVKPRWGSPSLIQGRAMALAVTLEFAAFQILGGGGFFAQMARATAWETGLAIVGFHFLLMRWSHGRWMAVLGLSVLVWLGAAIWLRLPLQLVALGDGLLKLAVGAVMAWPLFQTISKARSEPECRQESHRIPANSAG